ncbi:MAG: pantoate--beta-alanine ligase [Pseudohongiellaceae bacterium]
MLLINDIKELRRQLSAERDSGASICLVPTMGNLHAGHLTLVERAQQVCERAVVSIFVNPMQFGADEDFDKYPRTLDEDAALLEQQGCDFLFAPDVSAIYSNSSDHSGIELQTKAAPKTDELAHHNYNPELQTKVTVPSLGDNFCGSSRPGHFIGVTTVVNILFNLMQPDKACFGLKDYQQYLLIKQMTHDLRMNIEIIGVETHREANGLAMSSRNNYLSAAQREQAAILYQCLTDCKTRILEGKRDFSALEQTAQSTLSQVGLRPDYFAVCNAQTLQPPTPNDRHLAILAAAYMGNTRLIDNVRLELPA